MDLLNKLGHARASFSDFRICFETSVAALERYVMYVISKSTPIMLHEVSLKRFWLPLPVDKLFILENDI